MKKNRLIVSVVLVLLVALMVPMATMAATSPEVIPPVPTTPDSSTTTQGAFTFANVPAGSEMGVSTYSAAEVASLQAAAGPIEAGYTFFDSRNLTLTDASTGAVISGMLGQDVTVRVDHPEVKAGDKIMVVHLPSGGGVSKILATAYDGYFTFPSSHFSPFLFYINRASTTTTTTTATVSPQTGVYA